MTKESKIILAVAAAIIAGVVLLVSFVNSNQADPSAIMAKLVKEDSHRVGTGDIQVVEFGDFQCPACAQAHPDVQRIKEEYKDEITFVYRHFPLPMHPHAQVAAEAAEAAGSQGKFWEMHNKIFETQTLWSPMGDPTSLFVQYAEELELDTDQFSADVLASANKERISADQSDGYSVSVSGTPTFFVNGKKQDQFTYDSLKSAIEAERQ